MLFTFFLPFLEFDSASGSMALVHPPLFRLRPNTLQLVGAQRACPPELWRRFRLDRATGMKSKVNRAVARQSEGGF
jgi:hypothetical protein